MTITPNTLNFPRDISKARDFELEALEVCWNHPEVQPYYENKEAFERLEAVNLNTDNTVGISVAFVARTPNSNRFIELMIRDVSGDWAYAGYLIYSFHDDPASHDGIEWKVEEASMNNHYLLSYDNGATRVNWGLSEYGITGVGRYVQLFAGAFKLARER